MFVSTSKHFISTKIHCKYIMVIRKKKSFFNLSINDLKISQIYHLKAKYMNNHVMFLQLLKLCILFDSRNLTFS